MFRFRSFSHATDFICHFLNLRHLDLNRITWESDNDPYTVRRLRMLEPLIVHGKFTPKKATLMLTWLHIQCPPPKLISATFHVFEFNSRSGIPSAFGGNPPDTAHQWIAFGRCLYYLIFWSLLTICTAPYLGDLNSFGPEHCTNLKSIHFDHIRLWHGHTRNQKWVPDMLAQVKFCVVTELVFNLDLGGEHLRLVGCHWLPSSPAIWSTTQNLRGIGLWRWRLPYSLEAS